jgi:hypothetical protein
MIWPRFSFVDRSFSQLSTTTSKPAKQKPVIALSGHQIIGSTTRAWPRAVVEAIEAIAVNARMCPTRWTTRGPKIQPDTNPM